MKVLAIDTAEWTSSAALWEEGMELAFQENSQEKNQAAFLPHLVKDVLGSHTIDLLLTNVGPGSFTGIRIGMAFSKGLSMGLGIPLKGINSFMATYESLDTPEDVLILKEAHRQDVFAMRFKGGVSQPPQSLTRHDIETCLAASSPPSLAGSGIRPFLEGLKFKELVPHCHGAQAIAYAYFKNPTVFTEALPFYAREADVTPPSTPLGNGQSRNLTS